MPSMAHETLVDIFRNRPSLAAEMLVEALGVSLPAYHEAQVTSAELTDIRPAAYSADLVVQLLDADGEISRVVVVEVQLRVDPVKRFSWPDYITGSRLRQRSQVCLLVVAPSPDVAAWCAEPIETGTPGFVLHPPVLGRAAVPIVTDPAEAARRPELGVLSAMAHGDSDVGAAIAAAVLPAVEQLDEERARFYGDLVLTSLNEAARRALEAKMKGYEYQSDFARKYVAQGREEGEVTARARAVLTVLRVRGIEVSEDARERILAEKDAGRLERWIERAAVAASLAEVFAEPS